MAKKGKKPVEIEIPIGPFGEPVDISKPTSSPERMVLSIVGFPGCGKSSFMVAWQKYGFEPFFLAFQPGLEGYAVRTPVRAGERYLLTEFDDASRWIEWAALETDFNPIVLDPVAPLHDLCMDAEGGPSAVADRKGGAGWWEARYRFENAVKPVLKAGKCLVFISHLHIRDVYVGKETRSVYQMNLSGKVKQYVDQIVDIEMHFTIDIGPSGEQEWVALTRKDLSGIGKDRMGIIPDGRLSRGTSAEEAAKNFLSLFYDL